MSGKSDSSSSAAAAAAALDYGPMVSGLRAFFNSGKPSSLAFRRSQLKGLRKMLVENVDEFAEALHKDLGRHLQMCYFGDIYGSVTSVDNALDHLAEWAAPRHKSTNLEFFGSGARVIPQGKGVMLLICAFNFPQDFVFTGLAQMIAAGNCVVLKPSELSQHTERLFVRLIPMYMDQQCVRVVCGSIPEATALLRERWDHICFTGSEMVGRIVHKAAAKHLTPVTLELGGKGAAIVSRHADLHKAAKRILFSKYLNNGQICAAADHVLVERCVEAKFITELLKVAKAYPHGPLDLKNPYYGRLISKVHWDRTTRLLREPHNGKILLGGLEGAVREERFLPLTIVHNPDKDSLMMQREIFGPILPVITVNSVQEAVKIVNNAERPLVNYIFTQDASEARHVSCNVLSGSGAVNECALQFGVDSIPFGGVGASGMGRYHGIYGFNEFSHLKPVLDRGWLPMWTDLLSPLRYPPFSSFSTKMLRFAVLNKGPLISMARKISKLFGLVKNLTLLYFIVIGISVTFRQYNALSPDEPNF